MRKIILIISLVSVVVILIVTFFMYKDKIVFQSGLFKKFDGQKNWGDSTFCSINYTPEDSTLYYKFMIEFQDGDLYKKMNKEGYSPVLQIRDEHGFNLFERKLSIKLFMTLLGGINPSKADSLIKSKHFAISMQDKEKMLPEKFYRIKTYTVGMSKRE